MSKLKLEIESLAVESFGTTAAPVGDAGTVRAHAGGMADAEEAEAITSPPRTLAATCFETCRATCYGTCAASCFGTCFSCPIGCTDGCTGYTCATGGDVCCA